MKHLQSPDSRLDELDILFVPKMTPHFGTEESILSTQSTPPTDP